jgi:CBS domain-containing membrane protein
VAAIGATSIILFTLPHSPQAQPWSVLGGYLAATVFALLAAASIPTTVVAGAIALGATAWFMTRYKCVHPPGGALVVIVAGEGAPTLAHATQLMGVVLANALAVLLAAIVINNLLLRRRYPHCRQETTASLNNTGDQAPTQRTGLSHVDIDHAIRRLGTFVDIQEKELVTLYNSAVSNAFERHMGLSCGDVMARDVVTVEFGTELESAWNLLRRHKIKALPVVDSFRRLIGIVTVADFLRQLDDTTAAGLANQLQGLLRRTPGDMSEKAEVIGQIMTAKVYSATVATPVAELVHQLSDHGLHHIPVLDEKKKLVGMVTQSDLIAALYRRVALAAA